MFKVDRNKCIACIKCIKDCLARVISLKDEKADINNNGCIKCGHCIAICPVEAVSTDDYNMNEVIPYDKDTFYVEADTASVAILEISSYFALSKISPKI